MATSPYFNKIRGVEEQGLFEDLVVEMIQIAGVDVLYIPRKILEFDRVLKEPSKSTFDKAYPIEAYLPDGGNFGGEQNIMSKFGFRVNQTSEILVSKKRFDELGTGLLRPMEGDLIFIGQAERSYRSFTNTLMEINQVWYNQPDWQFGKHFTYKMVCETFTYNHETVRTGMPGPDAIEVEGPNVQDSISISNNDIIDIKSSVLFDKKNPFANL